MREWRLSGSVRNLGTESLTQKPTSYNHQLPLTAFETHNGRSTFAAGTALHAPFRSSPQSLATPPSRHRVSNAPANPAGKAGAAAPFRLRSVENNARSRTE